jgi:hypothetical protein
MMVMLILSKEFVKNNNVDVYLVPLVKKLQELWRGDLVMRLPRLTWQKT